MIHKTKVKCDIGLGLGGESQGGLYMTLFYKQLLWSPRFSSVGLLLSESLGLCQAGVLCVCGCRGRWALSRVALSLHRPASCHSSHSVARRVQKDSRFICYLYVYPWSRMEQL